MGMRLVGTVILRSREMDWMGRLARTKRMAAWRYDLYITVHIGTIMSLC